MVNRKMIGTEAIPRINFIRESIRQAKAPKAMARKMRDAESKADKRLLRMDVRIGRGLHC